MSSNIYRYSTLGESLNSTLEDLSQQYGISNETCERVRVKFDQVS